MEQAKAPIQIEFNHVLDTEQTKQLQTHVLKIILEAVDEATRKAGNKEVFNKKEACKFLGVSIETLERLIADGMPTHRPYERSYFFLKSEILEFIAQI